MRRVIGLSGRSHAGKDTVAACLVTRFGFVRVAVADHLKRAAQLAFALTNEQLWGNGRDVDDPRYGRTPRELYQRMGDAMNTIAPESMLTDVRRVLNDPEAPDIVVSDVRLPREVALIRAHRGEVWRVTRSHQAQIARGGAHHTETALDELAADVALANDGTVAELDALVGRHVQGWELRRSAER